MSLISNIFRVISRKKKIFIFFSKIIIGPKQNIFQNSFIEKRDTVAGFLVEF